MIKCPNCGSTAQVKRVDQCDWEARGFEGITENFKCGCGCHFNRKYQLYDIEIEQIEKRVDKPLQVCYNNAKR